MKMYSRTDEYSRRLLLAFYHCARLLGVINCSLDTRRMIVLQLQRKGKLSALVARSIVTLGYWSVLPHVFANFMMTLQSYSQILAGLQAVSVSLFAMLLFVMQTAADGSVVALLNRFLRLFRLVVRKTANLNILRANFLYLMVLKLVVTCIGHASELPSLLHTEHVLDLGFLCELLGVYMWLGSMFMLDVCFLGFLVLAALYEAMEYHLRRAVLALKYIEGKHSAGLPLTNYKRMQLLCFQADNLDDSGIIYHELYKLTQQFRHIFQWHILYCVCHHFMLILLLVHQLSWRYIHLDVIDLTGLFLIAVKFANLALLIMCADYAVRKSQLPLLLCLDLVCSDFDTRWDKSVEAFLNQRATEHLTVKVLDFFHLNNEFALLVLSAIVSYLFILIQFGLNGGFGSEVVK